MDAYCDIVCKCSKSSYESSTNRNRTDLSDFRTISKDSNMRRFCVFLLFCALFTTTYGCGPGRGIGGPRKYRKLTPLVFKEHYPKMSEKALGASGPAEGRISRNSTKFKDLVPNYNKDIIFKDEEGTGADRLMSKRCKEILNILAVSVMNQWPGVRLRVVESWDEDNFHGEESLHYEGRAVDITTSDRDNSKYGMLARLAVEAGFDWVYYETRAYIHCSVKSDSVAHSHRYHHNGCFAKDSTVLTKDGVKKVMSQIEIGDEVLSMNDKGEAVYSEVIMFIDRNLDQREDFVELKTDGGAALTVTAAHLIWSWNKQKSTMSFVFADKIQEGDSVIVHDETGHLRPQTVIEITTKRSQGFVAPLTREGTIVVDQVVASCYAVVNSQALAHWSLAPMRLWSNLKHWWPTKVKTPPETSYKSYNSTLSTQTTAQQQNGIHWYAKTLYALKDFIVPSSWRYQVFHR